MPPKDAVPLLRVDDLRTHLESGSQTVRAVDGVSFSIDRGETFCLVGESGSGKSITALSVIQLLPRSIASHPSGEIWFDYRHDDSRVEQVDMLRLSEPRRCEIRGSRIGMIFQEPMTCLNPVFTVGEQIVEALQLHRPDVNPDEARDRAIEALAQVHIPDPARRVDEYPHRLSGGQRQRVMIAMAMACEPDLLIADEPTTALDVTVQAEILRLMKELQAARGMSILFITHDFGVVSAMADRVAVMRSGRIVETGSLHQVLHEPTHAYTRQLLAALPENLARTRPPERRRAPVWAPIESSGSAREPARQSADGLLELENLGLLFPIKKGVMRRTVDYVRAVDGVSLRIHSGEILALVGESGSGKTSLGRAILRLNEPTSGRIVFAGRDVTALPQRSLRSLRRDMQIIFQDPMSSLNPRLTIAATLTEPMTVHGIGESREERLTMAEEVLSRVQLPPGSLWRYPHEFSGGQRQRIGIARALVLDPKFIICDEVTSALDVSVQAEILQILLDLRRERNLALLFITHDISVVEFISDTTAVMWDGKLVEVGTTEQVCGAPRHEYTKRLLAAVPRVGAGR